MLPQQGARDRAELQALHGIGVTVAHTVGYGAAEFGSCIARAAALCERVGYPPEFARISFLLFSFQRERGDLRNALATAERLYRWGSSRNDIAGRVLGHISVGMAHSALGNLVAARQHLERALELYNAHRGDLAVVWTHRVNAPRYVVRLASEIGLALLLCRLGYPEQALAHAAAAGKLAEDEDRNVEEAVYLWHYLWVLSFLCDPSELSAPAEKLAALSREQAQRQFAMHGAMMLGYATAHGGDPETGQRLLGEAIAAYVDDGALFGACHFRALLAETHLMMNETSAALAILAEALEETQRTGEKWYDAELHRWIGEAHRQSGDEARSGAMF